jgi:hypothetical protein
MSNESWLRKIAQEQRDLAESAKANAAVLDRSADALEQAQGELKIKSEFLSSRQCPDHSGKWQRGDCLQCRIEQLEMALRRLHSLPANEYTDSLMGYAGAVRTIAYEALETAGDPLPKYAELKDLNETCSECGQQLPQPAEDSGS